MRDYNNEMFYDSGLFFRQVSYDVQCKLTFNIVKALSKFHIVTISAGRTHTAAIDCELVTSTQLRLAS